jgi:NAD(P)-dependent dehydrogenase (short-subunit alcohol dehydrogenase family)
LTKYLSTYWPHKVRCNALCPGGVENQQSQEFLSRIKNRIPMGRMAAIDEYQGAIIFLLSRASSYMNGETLLIDGGRSAW